jgi:protein gp37
MNKIGWCDMTWNPVIGCKKNCNYCYAKRINDRFKFIKNWNIPEWREKSFNKKFPKKPQRIFVGSMSEIKYWKKEWILKVLDKIKMYPQHTFQFLTKHPEVYSEYIFPKNCWLGITITNGRDSYSEFRIAPENKENVFFICIEPMFDYIPIDCIDYADWVIIGLQTNPVKIIKKELIEKMIEQLREKDIPIFLKDSILKLYPEIINIYPSFHNYPDRKMYQWFRRTRI